MSLHKVFCLIGPSGAGKNKLAAQLPLPEVISYRTREIGKGEVDGVHGHFITKAEFRKMKEQDLWIAETDYAGNFYGITQGELLELEETPMIYVVDWDGVTTLKEGLNKIIGYNDSQVISIFIHAPREDLETRMIKRDRNKEEIKVRLDRADQDYAVSGKCDYVIENKNGEMDAAICEILKIILKESILL
jgi:guanylate kinase